MFPNVHTIDWTFINRLNLNELHEEEDKNIFKTVIRNFLDSNSLFSNPSYSPPELVYKFFQVLQLSVKYLVSENNSLKKYIKYQSEKIENLSQNVQNTKDIIKEKQEIIDNFTPEYKLVYQCPFCTKQFSSKEYFKYHYNRNHRSEKENYDATKRKELLDASQDEDRTKQYDEYKLRKHINDIFEEMDRKNRDKNKKIMSRRLVELERKYDDLIEEKKKRRKIKPTKINPFDQTI